MKRTCCALLVALVLMPAAVLARVEAEPLEALKLERPPIDLAASADGQSVFALLPGGEVTIYSPQGEVKGRIEVGKQARRIALSPKGDRLFWSDDKTPGIQVVAVNYVQQIETSGSPYKGPAEAPVTVAVFSDFQ